MNSKRSLIGKGKKVALGMSGGVDSSLSAYLLKEQGYQVTGVYLECWRAPGCRTEEDRKDALKVALELNIPFQVLDFKQQYKDKVVEYFFDEYEAGRTPNPDVLCNKEIKFGLFYDWSIAQKFDYIATGHYAQIVNSEQWTVDSDDSSETLSPHNFYLTTSHDSHKDQTYFLYRLRQEQLEHILFPIGHLTKAEVREEAKKRNIVVANKPDSQGICFIGEINVHNFLKERLGENPGDVVNTKGEVMGRHNGLWFYTVGQRHGFEIFGSWKSRQGEVKHALPPYYVIAKDGEKNQLVVGFGEETYQTEFSVTQVHWINPDMGEEILDVEKTSIQHQISDNLFVRIRHGGKLLLCRIIKRGTKLIVKLDEQTQGIAEGQSAVFYRSTGQPANGQTGEYICLGGGVISG